MKPALTNGSRLWVVEFIYVPCLACDGSGSVHESEGMSTCDFCSGTGTIMELIPERTGCVT